MLLALSEDHLRHESQVCSGLRVQLRSLQSFTTVLGDELLKPDQAFACYICGGA